MDNPFDFLKPAKPVNIHRLLERLSATEAALVLASLPPPMTIQVMAYASEEKQAEMMAALRDARQTPARDAAETAERIKKLLLAAKKTPDPLLGGQAAMEKQNGSQFGPPASGAYAGDVNISLPDSRASVTEKVGHGDHQTGKKNGYGPGTDAPVPWIPRQATSSPINGPAVAGQPVVSGDPMRSPLARAGLMDLIGRAQDTLLPKRRRDSPRVLGSNGPVRKAFTSGGRAAAAPSRPPPPRKREKPADMPVKPAPRTMDGKAIMAAILREADPELRHRIRQQDPGLFGELSKRMFYFDDLLRTEDNALARIFTAAPVAESSLALRFAPPLLRERVLRVVSPGRAEALQDIPPGRTGLDAIEAAQQRVLDVALQLQAAGRILIDPDDPDLAGQ